MLLTGELKPWSSALERHAAGAVLAALALAVVLLLAKPLVLLALPLPVNYNEGWNAYHAARLFSGGPLYPDPATLITNNYPPLSFYIVGGLGQIIGDNIFAGRLVALLSLLVVALNSALVVRCGGGTAGGAAFAGLLLIGYVAVEYDQYVATNDPQWLAHACMTTGLVMLVGGDTQSRWRVLAAAAMMIAGGLVKHNLVALPSAVTLWLLIYDRRRLVVWLAGSAVLVAAALLALILLYGDDFLANLLGTPRTYQPTRLLIALALWLTPLVPLFAAAVLLLLLDGGERIVHLLAFYAILAGLWGLFTVGGTGVFYNAFFELLIALVIAAGLLVERLGGPHPLRGIALAPPAQRALAMALLALVVLLPAPRTAGKSMLFLAELAEHRARSQAGIAFLAAQDGPVFCEFPAFCYWAGRPYEIDIANTVEKIYAGQFDEADLVAWIREYRFAAIHLEVHPEDGPAPVSRRLTPAINDAIAAHYQVVRTSSARGVLDVFLVPRTADSAG